MFPFINFFVIGFCYLTLHSSSATSTNIIEVMGDGSESLTQLYFAYGSNMQYQRLADRVGKIDKFAVGILENWILKFSKIGMDGSGKANIQPCIGANVHGVLFRLTNEQMNILDGFEGVPNHYFRQKIQVKLSDRDEIVECIAYIAKDKTVSKLPLKPTEEYLNFITTGCVENNFPVEVTKRIIDSAHLNLYFAYGADLSSQKLFDRVGLIDKIGNAELQDWELRFSKIGKDGAKANIHESLGSIVLGVIYALRNDQMNELDISQGVPKHYVRKIVKVHFDNPSPKQKTTTIDVITYVASEDKVSSSPIKPSAAYLETILQGCIENHFASSVIENIRLAANFS